MALSLLLLLQLVLLVPQVDAATPGWACDLSGNWTSTLKRGMFIQVCVGCVWCLCGLCLWMVVFVGVCFVWVVFVCLSASLLLPISLSICLCLCFPLHVFTYFFES